MPTSTSTKGKPTLVGGASSLSLDIIIIMQVSARTTWS